MRKPILLAASLASSIALSTSLPAKQPRTPEEVAMAALAAAPVWDGHNDVPEQLRDRRKDVLGTFDFRDTANTADPAKGVAAMQTDLRRMRAGHVGAQFWSVYVSANLTDQQAVQATLEQIDVTRRLVARYPSDLVLCTDSACVEAAWKQGKIASQTRAATGQVQGSDDAAWVLRDVQRSVFHQRAADEAQVEHQKLPEWRWPTNISADMIAASLLKPDRMATFDLFQYIRHLDDNGQSAQRYEIEFWRKVFYPLSCLVMVVLALPFAYLHFRSGSIAGYVFGGVMAGISFFLLNNVFGYAGNLQNWSPWLTAAAPGLIYSVLSLAAFGWLVLRR
mgnify:CR=1 FL=1